MSPNAHLCHFSLQGPLQCCPQLIHVCAFRASLGRGQCFTPVMINFMSQLDWAMGAHVLIKHSWCFCEGVLDEINI